MEKTHGTSTTVEGTYQITPTQDGGYIMCGIQRSFSTSNRFYVLKTDSFGNKEWDRVYNPQQHASAFSVFETEIGYIVSGYMYNTVTNYDMVIIQIDKLGDVMWQKFYGGNDSDSGCLLSSNADGNSYLAIGSIKNDNIKKPFIFSVDIQGNILWQKMYEMEVRALQEAPIFRTENDGAICIFGFDNQFGKTDIRIFKFTSTGDTLWTRTIPGLNPNDNWYLKDIDSTPDGGFIFSGFNYSQQSSWVVKTDSLGHTCSFIGCDSTVVVEVLPGIPSNANQEVSAMVYPVPTSTHLNIHYQIPAGILSSGNAGWYLYDMTGRQVAVETLYGSIGAVQVSVELLPAGVYYYRVVLPASGTNGGGWEGSSRVGSSDTCTGGRIV
ncbi:MAG: T9SS type A sorting domain-containing protein [Sphingobacteriales bacterium]|nr:MAG: T9SS type A sorting domain-containing protein [Sphingobacteriales bacterium]